MTKREAAIISAYTGFLIGEFNYTLDYIEEVLKRPVRSHELGNATLRKEVRAAAKNDFNTLVDNIED